MAPKTVNDRRPRNMTVCQLHRGIGARTMRPLRIFSGWRFLVAAFSLAQTATPQHDSEGCTGEDYATFSADGVHGKHKLDSVILLDHTAAQNLPGLAATTGVRSAVEAL